MQIYEIITQLTNLPLHCRLPIQISQERLLADYQNVIKQFRGEKQSGIYHDGGWKAIGLITSGGEVYADKLISGKPFLETPALEECPYVREILSQLPGSKNRVRFMFLEPRSLIQWHRDRNETIDGTISSRFHIPIITSSKIEFSICHNRCHWLPGHLYYGEFSFPHQIKSNWDQRRVHLVIDIVPNDDLRGLLPKSFLEEKQKRIIIRDLCEKSYFLQHRVPRKFRNELIKLKEKMIELSERNV